MISTTLILWLMMVSTSLTNQAQMDEGGLFPPIAKPVHINTPLLSRTDQNYLFWTVRANSNVKMSSSSIELARVEGSGLKDSRQYEHPFRGEMWSLGVNWYRGFIYHSNQQSDKIGLLNVSKSGIDASWMNGMQLSVSDIAVDYLTDNVYWIDGFAGKIFVGDSMLKKYTIITDVYATYLSKLAVDPYGRRLYWTEVQPNEAGKVFIRSCDLLGNDLKLVHTLNDCRDVGGLTFDHIENRLYWTENRENKAGKLTSAFRWTYFHANHSTSLSTKYEVETTNMAGIVSLKNYIYIIDMDRARLLIYDKNNLGEYPRQYSVKVGKISKIPTSFEAYGPDVQPRNETVLLQHPCYNHNCSDICIPSNQTSHECVCAYGKTLQVDGKSCSNQLLEDNFILMTDRKHEKIVQVHADNPSQVWHTLDINPGEVYLVDYDFSSKRVFWSSWKRNEVLSCKLDGSDCRVHLNNIPVSSMAIDHISRNLYFADSRRNSIGVMPLDSNRTNFFKAFPSEKMYNIGNIVVCSKLGKVFWTDLGLPTNAHFDTNQVATEETAFIESMDLDGSGRRVIASLKSLPHGLTINEEDHTLYWMDNKGISWLDVNGNMSSTRLNHSNIVRKVSYQHILFGDYTPIDLSYYDGYIYIVGVGHSVFYRVKVSDIHNEQVSYPEQFGPKMMYTATFIRFLNSSNYKLSADGGHECALNNGNCSQICLPTRQQNKTQAQCACTYDSEMIRGNCTKSNTTTTTKPKFRNCRHLQLIDLGPCEDTYHINHTLPTAYDSKGQRLTVKPRRKLVDQLVQGFHVFYSIATDRNNNFAGCIEIVAVIGHPCKDLQKSQDYKMVSNGTCANMYGSKRNVTCKEDGVSFAVTCTKKGWVAENQKFCPKLTSTISTHDDNKGTTHGDNKVAVLPTHGPEKIGPRGPMGGHGDTNGNGKNSNEKPNSIGRNVLISFGILLITVLLVGLGLYIKRNCGRLYFGPLGMHYSRGEDGVQLTKEDYSNRAFEDREIPLSSSRQNSVYTFPNA